jgi:ribonuclease HI
VEPDFLIFCDGGCTANPGELAVGAVVCTPSGEVLAKQARRAGMGTSNVAEYRALAYAIGLANLAGARQPLFCLDSVLVVEQLNHKWIMKGSKSGENVLAEEFVRCRTLLMEFDRWWLKHIPREKNKLADWLVCKELGHDRTTKKVPKVEVITAAGAGRPGWSQLSAPARSPRSRSGRDQPGTSSSSTAPITAGS